MNPIKHLASLLLLGAVPAFAQTPTGTPEESWSPQSHPVDRYGHIWTASPFVVATELAPVSPGLGERYLLTGYAKFDDKFTAFLFDRNTMTRITVRSGETNSGVKLTAINGAEDLKTAVAIIESEGQVGNIRHGQPNGEGGVASADVGVPQAPAPPAANSDAVYRASQAAVRRRVIIRQAPINPNQ